VGLTLTGCAVVGLPLPERHARPADASPGDASPVDAGRVVVESGEARVAEDAPLVATDGFVLLDPKAVVREAPRANARGSDIDYGYVTNYPFTYGKPRPARVVGRSGAFYAIASGPGPGHCYPHRGVFQEFEVVVYVHESDVVDTVTRPVHLTFADGTSLRLSPGVALGSARPSGMRTVFADPLEIVAEVPDDAVGPVYRPALVVANVPPSDAEIQHCRDESCRLEIGEARARIATEYIEVATLERRGAAAFVGLAAPCAAVRARVSSEVLRPLPESRTLQGMGHGCGGVTDNDFVAPPEAEVFWPDGRVAGRVGRHRVYLHRHQSRVVGARRCFKRHAAEGYTCGSEGKYLELCVDESRLSTIGSYRSSE